MQFGGFGVVSMRMNCARWRGNHVEQVLLEVCPLSHVKDGRKLRNMLYDLPCVSVRRTFICDIPKISDG